MIDDTQDVQTAPCRGFLNLNNIIYHCQKADGHDNGCLFKNKYGIILHPSMVEEVSPEQPHHPNGMTQAEFMAFFRRLTAECGGIMEQANQEYASDEEKFDNFVGIAEFFKRFNPRLKDITPHDVAGIYFLKHFISITKGISKREGMEGRYKDAINYQYLMAGMQSVGLA